MTIKSAVTEFLAPKEIHYVLPSNVSVLNAPSRIAIDEFTTLEARYGMRNSDDSFKPLNCTYFAKPLNVVPAARYQSVSGHAIRTNTQPLFFAAIAGAAMASGMFMMLTTPVLGAVYFVAGILLLTMAAVSVLRAIEKHYDDDAANVDATRREV